MLKECKTEKGEVKMSKEFVNIKENGEEVTVKAVYHSEVSNGTSTSSITTYEDGKIVCKVGQSQLERIENKVDRILELLEDKELSTSSLEIGKLSDLPDDVLRRNKLGKYASN